MSKMTLLEIVQSVHNALNLDLVNSISDTTESVRVAAIARDVFFEFINRREWPHLRTITELESAVDLNNKTMLLLPEDTARLDYLTYSYKKIGDMRFRQRELCYKEPGDFLIWGNAFDSTNTAVEEMTSPDGVAYFIKNDRAPTYWTSFDDETIVLDSYDSLVENTIQGIKTQAQIQRNPTWVHTDLAVPDLPEKAFPGYLAEVKSVCFVQIKETPDAKSEQQATRQQRRLSNQAWIARGGIRRPNYGRNRGGRYYTSVARATFRSDRD